MTQLTKNFTLEELSSFNFAAAHGLKVPDSIPEDMINELQKTANLLQDIRDAACVYFGRDIRLRVTNAWRWKVLNDMVGSNDKSAHLWGGGADLVPYDISLEDLFEVARRDLSLMKKIDQLIHERGCIHVGRAKEGKEPRHELRGEAWVPNETGKLIRRYPLIEVVKC